MSVDFKWRHYRGEVIFWAVRWYCRYGISYRELAEMLCERGVEVDRTTVYRWVQHYAPEMDESQSAIGLSFGSNACAGSIDRAVLQALDALVRPISRLRANGSISIVP